MQKYGLSATDAAGSDHEKGIVAHQGSYYQIDGFKREQNEDIDTDQGKVFGSSLESDAGVDYSNFNTATDVENALKSLDGEKSSFTPDIETKPPSERLATARERVKQYEDDKWSGRDAEKLYTPMKDTKGFLDKYKTNFKKNLETANKTKFGATE